MKDSSNHHLILRGPWYTLIVEPRSFPPMTSYSHSRSPHALRRSELVLLALTDPKEGEVLSTHFELEGLTTLTTDLGAIALALAAKEEPDLIILDLILSDLSAYEVSRALKASPCTRGITRVAITDSVAAILPEGAHQAGLSECFCRPFTPAQLVSDICSLLPRPERKRGSGRVWPPVRPNRYSPYRAH